MWVKVLCFPIRSLKRPRFCKVCSIILMFLLALSFNFNSSSGIAPVFEGLLQFFLASLISHDFVLRQKPHFLYLLLLHVICGKVIMVVRATLEAILGLKYYFLLVIGVKTLKRVSCCSSLFLFEQGMRLSCVISES